MISAADILTLENLRPMADAIAVQFAKTNEDASIRLDALTQAEDQIGRIVDAIAEVGMSSCLKAKLRQLEGEREKLRSEIEVLEQHMIPAPDVSAVTDDMIVGWLESIKVAITGDDVENARYALRQFVEKIILRGDEGEIVYSFGLPMPATDQTSRHLVQRSMDLRVSGTLTRHILRFDIPLSASTESDLRNPDKTQLRADILAMRANGMSYRQIARKVGLHWTRVGQIARMEKDQSETG